MPNILFVTTVPSTLRAFLLPFAQHLRMKGWRVDAAASGLTDQGDLVHQFSELHDISFARSLRRPWALLKAARVMESLCRRNDYDIVHVHTPIAAFITRLALRNLRRERGLRVVYTAHGFHFFAGASWPSWLLYGLAEKCAGRWTDRLVVINSEDFDRARRLNIVPDERLIEMPGIGVDPHGYVAPRGFDSGESRRQLGVSGKFLILMIAEFNARKRQVDLVRALAKLNDPSVAVILVGEGVGQAAVRRLSEKLGIQGQVKFLGFRRDVPSLLAISDLLVLPSSQEGLPRCVLEAMAAGVPVVASDVRGSRDLLADGRGWLFRLGDVEALSRCIQRIRTSKSEVAHKINLSKKAVRETYALERIVCAHDDLYEGLLSRRLAASGPTRDSVPQHL